MKYETIQELDLQASAAGTPWHHHSPSVEAIATQITSQDSTTANGATMQQPYAFLRQVQFKYREPAYDRWQRRFVGFRKTAQQNFGEDAVTETTRWYGPCEKQIIDVDLDHPLASDSCAQTSDDDRDSARTFKALVGRVVRVDRYIPNAINQTAPGWLWTKTFTYDPPADVVPHAANRRNVRFAFPRRITTHVYDPAHPVGFGSGGTTMLAGGDEIENPPSQSGEVMLVQNRVVDVATGIPIEVRDVGVQRQLDDLFQNLPIS